MAKKNGFVYYEADAMLGFSNPFVPLDVDNPSLATRYQKSLKVTNMITHSAKLEPFCTVYFLLVVYICTYFSQGVSREDAEILMTARKDMEILLSPDISSFDEKIQPLLKLISREIGKQKKRLGGNFAVAHAVVSR